MTTIGDSFAIVALLMGIGLTTWALYLATALTFRTRAEIARERITGRPVWSFVIGLVVTLTIGVVFIAMAANPFPPAKILGLGGVFGLIALSALGGAGLSLHLSDRIRAMDPELSIYQGLTRAAMLIVVASFFPFVGWFFIAPILFVTSLGVGCSALISRSAPSYEVS